MDQGIEYDKAAVSVHKQMWICKVSSQLMFRDVWKDHLEATTEG